MTIRPPVHGNGGVTQRLGEQAHLAGRPRARAPGENRLQGRLAGVAADDVDRAVERGGGEIRGSTGQPAGRPGFAGTRNAGDRVERADHPAAEEVCLSVHGARRCVVDRRRQRTHAHGFRATHPHDVSRRGFTLIEPAEEQRAFRADRHRGRVLHGRREPAGGRNEDPHAGRCTCRPRRARRSSDGARMARGPARGEQHHDHDRHEHQRRDGEPPAPELSLPGGPAPGRELRSRRAHAITGARPRRSRGRRWDRPG